jgi:hypothetical protein
VEDAHRAEPEAGLGVFEAELGNKDEDTGAWKTSAYSEQSFADVAPGPRSVGKHQLSISASDGEPFCREKSSDPLPAPEVFDSKRNACPGLTPLRRGQ